MECLWSRTGCLALLALSSARKIVVAAVRTHPVTFPPLSTRSPTLLSLTNLILWNRSTAVLAFSTRSKVQELASYLNTTQIHNSKRWDQLQTRAIPITCKEGKQKLDRRNKTSKPGRTRGPRNCWGGMYMGYPAGGCLGLEQRLQNWRLAKLR